MIYRRLRQAVDARPTLSRYDVLVMAGPVAQRLEQRTHNPLVLGSNPSGPTNKFLRPAFAISWFFRLVYFPQIREHREQNFRDALHSAALRVRESHSQNLVGAVDEAREVFMDRWRSRVRELPPRPRLCSQHPLVSRFDGCDSSP